MSLNTKATLDAIQSHAMTLGLFERVNLHEPKNAPGNGLTVAMWFQNVAPVRSSGLARTSARVEYSVRLYTNMLADPQDMIDPNLADAADVLINAYSGDFDLGETVRNVDLLGQAGVPLSAEAGYLNQDGKNYRVITITLPLIVNDVWEQVP